MVWGEALRSRRWRIKSAAALSTVVLARLFAVVESSIALGFISPSPSDDAFDTRSASGRAPGECRSALSKYRHGRESSVPCANQHHFPPYAWHRSDATCAEKPFARKQSRRHAPSATPAGELACFLPAR